MTAEGSFFSSSLSLFPFLEGAGQTDKTKNEGDDDASNVAPYTCGSTDEDGGEKKEHSTYGGVHFIGPLFGELSLEFTFREFGSGLDEGNK